MKNKGKISGMMAAVAIIISLLVVSVPAKEQEGAEKIPKEEREWMAQEEKKIQGELKDPEFVKKLERSKNRKWYSYEELYGKELDEEDREYMRILKRMEREGIDTNELFEEIEERTIGRYVEAQKRGTEYQPEKIDILQFAKKFERRKLEERKGSVHIEKENKANENFDINMWPLRGDVDTDFIYYSPWDQDVWITNNDDAKFYLEETEFAGIGVWVHLKENRFFKKVELWSEAKYRIDSGTWVKYGYPDEAYGGAQIIENNGYVYTSTGNAYHTDYPTINCRNMGAGSQTGISFYLCSHSLHQQAVLS
ncbi:MAG: hypothetical protein U9N35_07695 [Euryarchaeota archaeon]|nr:hypothetical protein [Euryarchaeota archaeon]